jgi:hypothetical protein
MRASRLTGASKCSGTECRGSCTSCFSFWWCGTTHGEPILTAQVNHASGFHHHHLNNGSATHTGGAIGGLGAAGGFGGEGAGAVISRAQAKAAACSWPETSSQPSPAPVQTSSAVQQPSSTAPAANVRGTMASALADRRRLKRRNLNPASGSLPGPSPGAASMHRHRHTAQHTRARSAGEKSEDKSREDIWNARTLTHDTRHTTARTQVRGSAGAGCAGVINCLIDEDQT